MILASPATRPNGPPAYLDRFRKQYGHLARSLQEGTGSPYAILSYKGKVWSVRSKGDKRPLTNDQGDPVSRLQVVILDASPKISKKYYAKGFVDGADDPPDCQSPDGVTSDPQSPNRQAVHCASCPLNQWGSRVTDQGKKAKACADNRRMAVMAIDDVGEDNPKVGPMLLNVPPASLGAVATYGDQLVRHGLIPQAVVTSIGFNPAKAYPELQLRGDGILPEDKIDWVIERMENDPTIKRIISQLTELEETTAANARKEPSATGTVAAAHNEPRDDPEPTRPAPAPAPTPPKTPPPATARGTTTRGGSRKPAAAPVDPGPDDGGNWGQLQTDTPSPVSSPKANGGAGLASFEVGPGPGAESLAAAEDGDGEAEGTAGDTEATVTDAGQQFDNLWAELSTTIKQ